MNGGGIHDKHWTVNLQKPAFRAPRTHDNLLQAVKNYAPATNEWYFFPKLQEAHGLIFTDSIPRRQVSISKFRSLKCNLDQSFSYTVRSYSKWPVPHMFMPLQVFMSTIISVTSLLGLVPAQIPIGRPPTWVFLSAFTAPGYTDGSEHTSHK